MMSSHDVRERSVALACLLVSSVLLTTCGPEWRQLTRESDGFHVSLPGPVTCVPNIRIETEVGAVSGTRCSAEAEFRGLWGGHTATFQVSWWDLPRSIAEWDAEKVRLMLWQEDSSLQPRVSRSVSLGGVKATEYEYAILGSEDQPLPPGFERTVRLRYAVRDGKLYRVEVHGSLDAALEKVWEEVLESFQFVELPPPRQTRSG